MDTQKPLKRCDTQPRSLPPRLTRNHTPPNKRLTRHPRPHSYHKCENNDTRSPADTQQSPCGPARHTSTGHGRVVPTRTGSHSTCSLGSLRFHFAYPSEHERFHFGPEEGKGRREGNVSLSKREGKDTKHGCQPKPPNPTASLRWAPARPKDMSPTSLPCWPAAYSRAAVTGLGLFVGK